MFKQDEDMLRYGAMALDHLFIRDYLPAANGEYVKVYIYGLYLCQHPAEDMSLSEMAHDLGMEPAEADAALRYWERRHLVRRVSDNPPEYLFRSAAQLALSGDRGMEADPAYVAFYDNVDSLFDGKRKVNPAEISQAWDWVQDPLLQLPEEVVMMLLSHMMDTNGINFTFKAAEKEALRLRDEHILTVEDAESYFAHSLSVHKNTRKILRHLGKRRLPSEEEIKLYRKWTESWGYTPEAILAACQETTKGEPTFAYLDGILRGIRERAEMRGEAPRAEAEVQQALGADAQEREAVQAFANALGFHTASTLIENAYRRLVRQYDRELVQLVAQEAPRNGSSLDAIDKQLDGFARRGITTYAAAKAYFDDVHAVNQALRPLFEACGRQKAPTPAERTLYKKWQSWGYGEEMLLSAAVQAGRFDAMKALVEEWHRAGVATPEQAVRYKPAETGGKRVTAQQYDQRQYTEEELENGAGDL